MPLNEEDLKVFKTWLKDILRTSKVTVTFTKTDGSERVMLCTTCPTYIPVVEVEETEPKKERKTNDDVMNVFDVESNGWRSFRWDRVKTISLSLIGD
jgi:uncharacterized protein with PIN domain